MDAFEEEDLTAYLFREEETGEANGKVGFLLRHVVEFGLLEIVHEVLADHAEGVL